MNTIDRDLNFWQNEHKRLNEGDRVETYGVNDQKMTGEVIDLPHQPAGHYKFQVPGQGKTTLFNYWSDRRDVLHFTPAFPVVKVAVDEPGNDYAFPINRVQWSPITDKTPLTLNIVDTWRNGLGYVTKTQFAKADIGDLIGFERIGRAAADEIIDQANQVPASYETGGTEKTEEPEPDGPDCPACESLIVPEMESAIEGEQGELYCSLGCLNGDMA